MATRFYPGLKQPPAHRACKLGTESIWWVGGGTLPSHHPGCLVPAHVLDGLSHVQ